MKYKTVKTAEQWATIKAMGDYEQDYKNGELWYYNGDMWYLSHLELSPEELREIVEFEKGSETI